jgi:hypothetical protein
MDPDPDSNADPDLAFYVSELQDIKKFVKSFFAYYFLKVHLHYFSKIKCHKEVAKQLESMFFTIYA